MSEERANRSWADRAIEQRSHDQLNRSDFSDRIADALVDDAGQATGVVIGLTGPWGSGKTSILNLVEECIAEKHSEVITVFFNPWLITSRDDLITAFLADIRSALEARGGAAGRSQQSSRFKDLAKAATDYGRRLAPVANMVAPGIGTAAAGLFDAAGRAFSGGTLHDLRTRLAKRIVEFDIHVVVLIDEIDRLEDAEIGAITQLVRAVADFPNFSYLLAYDEDRVAQALGRGVSERGQAYLEKIVQIQIPVPLIMPDQIRSPLRGRVRELLKERVMDGFSEDRLNKLLGVLIPDSIATLRDMKRLLGVFEVLTSMLRFELDLVDALGWAALLTKYPGVERVLRRHRHEIIGDQRHLFGEPLLDKTLLPGAIQTKVHFELKSVSTLILKSGEDTLDVLAEGRGVNGLYNLLSFLFSVHPEFDVPLDRVISILALAKTLTFGILVDSSRTGTAQPHPRYVDVIRSLSKKDGQAWAQALEEADSRGNLAEYCIAICGCGRHAYPASPEDILISLSRFIDRVPLLTEPSREPAGRIIAKFLSGPYWTSLRREDLPASKTAMLDWIDARRFALPAHLLELHLAARQGRLDEVHPARSQEKQLLAPRFLEDDDLNSLLQLMTERCRASLEDNGLIGTIPDIACLRVISQSKEAASDESIWRTLQDRLDDAARLDRFVWYCFGQNRSGGSWIVGNFLDDQRFGSQLTKRWREWISMPDQVRDAYSEARLYLTRHRV